MSLPSVDPNNAGFNTTMGDYKQIPALEGSRKPTHIRNATPILSSVREQGFKKNNFMQFAGMGVQMAAVIGMGAYGGYLLDEKYQTEKAYWTAGLALFGVLISLYLLIKKANSMSNEK